MTIKNERPIMNTILKLYSFFVATEQIDSAEIMQMLCEIGFPDFQ